MEFTRPTLLTRSLTAALLVSVLISLPLLVLAADSIGIAAVATDTKIEGKGEFKINGEVTVGDIIKTGEKGSVTILFNDESMLTLGPNSSARLDVFKDGTPGEAKLTILSGNFRYFPGKILENGGSQTVINQGAKVADNSSPDVAINETGLNTAIDNSDVALDIKINDLNLTDVVAGSAVADTGSSTSGVGGDGKAGFK